MSSFALNADNLNQQSTTLTEQEVENIHEPIEALVLFATETGTAHDAAERLVRHLSLLHPYITPRLVDMAEYPPEDLVSSPLTFFLVSTTGSGAEPRSMTPLWRLLLRSDLPMSLFDEMDFAIFGLGDSAYERFCWPAKLLSRRLAQLGAREVIKLTNGDEQDRTGIDGTLDTWIKEVVQTLIETYLPPEQTVLGDSARLYAPRCSIDLSHEKDINNSGSQMDFGKHRVVLRVNKRITAFDWYQDVRHLEFEIEEDINFSPGDVAVIMPSNSKDSVASLLDTLGWTSHADHPILVSRANDPDVGLPVENIPQPTTLRVLLTHHLDISFIPRRFFFSLLAKFSKDDTEREKLEDLGSVAGADDLYDYVTRPRRMAVEVIADFHSIGAGAVPREYVLDLFPNMRPRKFSIASSLKKHPHQIHLCVAIVKYKTIMKAPRLGVCTQYLSELEIGASIRLDIEPGLFILPKEINTPVVCVGPGTGVAPMRAVIEDRVAEGANGNNLTLYFGHRSLEKDAHYANEWLTLSREQLLRYRVACSRAEVNKPRTYVQHLMGESYDQKRLYEDIVERNGSVLISGSSNKMPAAIRAALVDMLKVHGGMNEGAAKNYIIHMEREKRLIEECWS